MSQLNLLFSPTSSMNHCRSISRLSLLFILLLRPSMRAATEASRIFLRSLQ